MGIHRLMIVDDDEILREGIEKNADWMANGIQVVGTARNGRECLEMIPDCLPEIILTDIKMPFMDGMQLCEAVYNLYPSIRIVLLTAYDDFSYAQKALDYKVTEYVMKFEDNETIVNAVKKAAAEYDKQKSNAEILRSSARLLKNKFLKDWALEPYSREQMEHRAKQLGLTLPFPGFQVLSLGLTPEQNTPAAGVWRQEQYQEQFGNLFADCISGEEQQASYFLAEGHLHVLLNTGDEIRDEKLLPVLRSVEDVLKIRAVAGIGRRYAERENVSKSYREAVQALEYQSILQSEAKNSKTVYFNSTIGSGALKDSVIDDIIAFIQRHYGEKTLSLNVIAEAVHLTPSYVSSLFKKNCNTNITDYLTKIRMAKAKELLEKTNLRTYEISERIGYSNAQYFSVLFKRMAGFSPTEYRQKALKNR